MDIVAYYICISLAGLLAGAVAGCLGGLMLGWLLAIGYHKHVPFDDAPAMATAGLMLVGACLGAIVGLALGINFCMRLARDKELSHSK